MMFLLGRHAMFGHDPPMYLRSIAATRLPSAAKVHAAIVDPVPPPRISTSKSSIFASFDTRADEVSFEFFIPVSSQEVLYSDSKRRIVRPATWYPTPPRPDDFSRLLLVPLLLSRSDVRHGLAPSSPYKTKLNDLTD